MKLAIPRESRPREARVALTPDAIGRLVRRKLEVVVQSGAGAGAHIADAEYTAAGAHIEPDATATWRAADVILKVQPPTDAEIELLGSGQTLISLLYPRLDGDRVRALAARGASALAADMVPRTTLAQAMDVLSSQATVAGYRAALLAATAAPTLFPMMMTAAGTVAPARVLVIGAGVAGLQAIATARRLGATVEAFDVRRAAKEQVESLGARFVEVPAAADAEGQGGYAREQSADDQARQAAVLAEALTRVDAVITTALIPGRGAPTLITADMVRGMRPGAVIVDIAAEQGGNCALTRPGQRRVTDHGVTIIGDVDLASQVARDASQMYARNMEKLLVHLAPTGELALTGSDPILTGMLIVRGGTIVHDQVAAPAGKELAA